MAAKKDDLFKRTIATVPVSLDHDEVEGVEPDPDDPRVVLVRPLTRTESLSVTNREIALDEVERIVLSYAMVDPPMTTGEVRLWQESSVTGEIGRVMNVVQRISGITKKAQRDAIAEFRR